jgi:hypothetical protein
VYTDSNGYCLLVTMDIRGDLGISGDDCKQRLIPVDNC